VQIIAINGLIVDKSLLNWLLFSSDKCGLWY